MQIKILHRTFTRNLNLKQNLITKQDYFRIRNLAWEFLLQFKISTLPLRFTNVCNELNLKLIKYTQLERHLAEHKLDKHDIEALEKQLNQSSGAMVRLDDENCLFYNDQFPIEVQRFTVAHELGHYYLKHRNIDEDDTIAYNKAEMEANMFAARILMPLCVLKELKIKSVQDVMDICLVSEDAAKYRYKRLNEVVTPRNKFYTNLLELRVVNNFQAFINSKKQ